MKMIAGAISRLHCGLVQAALCAAPLLLAASPAAAQYLATGDDPHGVRAQCGCVIPSYDFAFNTFFTPNPQAVGGTLNAIVGFNFEKTGAMSLTLLTNSLGAPIQVFLVALVPTGTLGLPQDTWFIYDGANWQQFDGNFVPAASGLTAGSTLDLSVPSSMDLLRSLQRTEVYVGYGTSAQEMLQAKRFQGVVKFR